MTAPPEEGLTWCEEEDRWAFVCQCERMQSYAPPSEPGGITTFEAEFVGWRLVDGKWVCPFCTGNLENLKKVFKREVERGREEG